MQRNNRQDIFVDLGKLKDRFQKLRIILVRQLGLIA